MQDLKKTVGIQYICMPYRCLGNSHTNLCKNPKTLKCLLHEFFLKNHNSARFFKKYIKVSSFAGEVIDILEIFRMPFFFKKKIARISNLGRKSQFKGFNHFSSAAGSLGKIWREEEVEPSGSSPSQMPRP